MLRNMSFVAVIALVTLGAPPASASEGGRDFRFQFQFDDSDDEDAKREAEEKVETDRLRAMALFHLGSRGGLGHVVIGFSGSRSFEIDGSDPDDEKIDYSKLKLRFFNPLKELSGILSRTSEKEEPETVEIDFGTAHYYNDNLYLRGNYSYGSLPDIEIDETQDLTITEKYEEGKSWNMTISPSGFHLGETSEELQQEIDTAAEEGELVGRVTYMSNSFTIYGKSYLTLRY